jgi:hypothetical protein
MEKDINRLYEYTGCFYSPVMNGCGAEPAARQEDIVRDNESELANLGKPKAL